MLSRPESILLRINCFCSYRVGRKKSLRSGETAAGAGCRKSFFCREILQRKKIIWDVSELSSLSVWLFSAITSSTPRLRRQRLLYGSYAGDAAFFYAGVCELQIGKYEEALSYLNKYNGKDEILKAKAIKDQYPQSNGRIRYRQIYQQNREHA